MMRPAAVVLATALALSACGDDGGDQQARTEAFCDQMQTLEDSGETIDLNEPTGLAQFEELVADAPDAVREDLEYFVDKTAEFEDIDENDPEAIGDALGLFFDPEFIESIQGFGTFMRDQCGIDIPGLEELDDLEPGQLEEELDDLEGEFGDLQNQLEDGFGDLQDQLEDQFGDLDTTPPASGGD